MVQICEFYAIDQQPAMLNKVISFNLADIGEGIVEAEVMEWYVSEEIKLIQIH